MLVNSTVNVQCVGGLGNQLFAYYAGMWCAQTRESVLRVDLSLKDRGITNHNVSIGDFNIFTENVVEKNQRFRIWRRLRFVVSSIFQKNITKGSPVKPFNFYTSSSPDNDLKVLTQKSSTPIHLRGHFISKEVLDFASQKSRARPLEIRVKSNKLREAMEAQVKINPVSVHFRVGDYLEKRVNRDVLSADYFLEILNRDESRKKPVWIFTDSKNDEQVQHLAEQTGALIVSDVFKLSASEEFYLLMQSSSLVCSNSTFSFMAAALGQVKHVTVPGIPEFEGIDAFFPHWEVKLPIFRN